MTHEEAFLQAMVDDPSAAFLFADWLEERGDPRGELLRLTYSLTRSVEVPERAALERRLRALLESGVRPVGPFRTNAIGMTFAWIPPGTFLMGSPPDEPDHRPDETQHRVTLTTGFWMGVHPVTRAQWQAVTEASGGASNCGSFPARSIRWDEAVAFCEELCKKDGKPYRLPAEAEWEYACRAGTTTPFHFGDTISTDQANYNGNWAYGAGKKGVYRLEPTPVGSFPANAWGLHDMHGNAWEWCQDLYAPYQQEYIRVDTTQSRDEARVLRGGSWHALPWVCRAAYRWYSTPYSGSGGCRVALGLD